MKDREKAYRDKVLGAQFIEFLRKRLILLREVLCESGFLVLHIDYRFGHYLKVLLDEIFGSGFRNEITVPRGTKNVQNQFDEITSLSVGNDSLYLYAKSLDTKMPHLRIELGERAAGKWDTFWRGTDRKTMRYNLFGQKPTEGQWRWKESRALRAVANYEKYQNQHASIEDIDSHYLRSLDEGIDVDFVRLNDEGVVQYYVPPRDSRLANTIWTDVRTTGKSTQYPTEKHEDLLSRLIGWLSTPGDIVLDCFAGSGTTAAVAEKLDRRWIAMDCGKLAIYTIQKRLFSLTTAIGAGKKDDRTEPERVEDWSGHLKSAPGVLLITEKARKGECEVTLDLLHDLAELVKKHGLIKKDSALSLACPEEKLRIPQDRLEEPEDGPGAKRLVVNGVEFCISFVVPREKAEKEQPLPAKEFALYRAGVYDMDAIRKLPWTEYRPFVLRLFGVREEAHQRYGFRLDGYLNTNAVLLWNYPENKKLTLDYGYVDELHRTLRGKTGERFYIIAPVVAMAFAEDEVVRDQTTYVFLKVPLSVLLRLLEKKTPAALKQPAREEDVNEVIDAIGFDFICQPQVTAVAKRDRREDELFADWMIEIEEFRAQTLATDPEDFANFETFSMAMVDLDYDGDVFRLGKVFWAEDLLKEAGGLEQAQRLTVRIPEREFAGERMMVILCDRYGNEKTLVFGKGDFADSRSAPRKARGGRRGAR